MTKYSITAIDILMKTKESVLRAVNKYRQSEKGIKRIKEHSKLVQPITIKRSTVARLKALKGKGMTYDDIIINLLEA